MTLSAVIITQNEARNIERCLTSLAGIADEVVVVDSGSTDDTKAICLRHGAQFHHHEWAGYSEQKNYAETLSHGRWTLSIDADEALSDRLRDSLTKWKCEQNGKTYNGSIVNTYSLDRLTNYCGTWIHHCGWYPNTKIRLWPHGAMRWDGAIHEDVVPTDPGAVVVTQSLHGDLLHYSYYDIEDHARRQPKYYLLAANNAYEKGERCTTAAVVFKPLWTFCRDYLLDAGFLDGEAGFMVCKMNAHYTFMKYATLRQLTKRHGNQ